MNAAAKSMKIDSRIDGEFIWFTVPSTDRAIECTEAGDFRHALSRTSLEFGEEYGTPTGTQYRHETNRRGWDGAYSSLLATLALGSSLYQVLRNHGAPLHDRDGIDLRRWLDLNAITLIGGSFCVEGSKERDKRWADAERRERRIAAELHRTEKAARQQKREDEQQRRQRERESLTVDPIYCELFMKIAGVSIDADRSLPSYVRFMCHVVARYRRSITTSDEVPQP
jgi:hypothetical protein